MNSFIKWKYEKQLESKVKLLNSLGYECHGVTTAEEARAKVLELIPKEAEIGFGGSLTMNELGVVQALRDGGYNILDRFKAANHQEDLVLRKKALTCDYFLSGVNAITKKGELCFVDAQGNRPAAVLFGPGNVIIAASLNKFVKDLAEAEERCYSIAPINANRNNHKDLPCGETGDCPGQCYRRDCMCNSFTVIRHCLKNPGRIKIVLVADELGL